MSLLRPENFYFHALRPFISVIESIIIPVGPEEPVKCASTRETKYLYSPPSISTSSQILALVPKQPKHNDTPSPNGMLHVMNYHWPVSSGARQGGKK
jgi:hypothetical protein